MLKPFKIILLDFLVGSGIGTADNNAFVYGCIVLLNNSLELLYEARKLDTSNRYSNIPELITNWGTESGHTLGSGMCLGNIDKTSDVDCPNDQSYVNKPYIKHCINKKITYHTEFYFLNDKEKKEKNSLVSRTKLVISNPNL